MTLTHYGVRVSVQGTAGELRVCPPVPIDFPGEKAEAPEMLRDRREQAVAGCQGRRPHGKAAAGSPLEHGV